MEQKQHWIKMLYLDCNYRIEKEISNHALVLYHCRCKRQIIPCLRHTGWLHLQDTSLDSYQLILEKVSKMELELFKLSQLSRNPLSTHWTRFVYTSYIFVYYNIIDIPLISYHSSSSILFLWWCIYQVSYIYTCPSSFETVNPWITQNIYLLFCVIKATQY